MDGTLLAASLFGALGSCLAVAATFALYLGVTLLVDLVRAYGSGWRRAAKVYRAETRPRHGPSFFSYRSAFWHWISPLRSNVATLTEQGIYLEAPYWLCRPFHPPLMLPWPYFHSMKALHAKSSLLVELAFEDPAGRRLGVPLPDKALPALRRWSRREDFSVKRLR